MTKMSHLERLMEDFDNRRELADASCACALIPPKSSNPKIDTHVKDTPIMPNPKWQSPINLNVTDFFPAPFSNTKIFYKPKTAYAVVKDHDTISVTFAEDGNLDMRLAEYGYLYHLVEFHFHAPAETLVGGKAYDLEMHLVHRRILEKEERPTGYCNCVEEHPEAKYVYAPSPVDKIPGWTELRFGHLAVIGFFFEMGEENLFLSQVFDDDGHLVLPPPNKPSKKKVMWQNLGADHKPAVAYPGSLTTGNYTAGVAWTVVESVQQLSPDQLNSYLELAPEPHAREVQPLNGRPTKQTWIEQFNIVHKHEL
jgi:carbonic anhydrase